MSPARRRAAPDPRHDRLIPRAGTGSVKWEYRETAAGHGSGLEPATDPDVIPMWVADMDFACPEAVPAAIRRRAEHPIFGYSLPGPGFLEAFCAWAEARHGFRPDPAWVVPTEGIVPDLGMLVRTLLEPGEGVIVHPPVYFPFFGAVRNNRGRLVSCPLREAGGPAAANPYRLDLERFDHLAAAPENRMTILCSPHNPVGRAWTRDELRAVARIAARRRLIVISDEIHADLMLEGRSFHPWLSLEAADRSRSIVCSAPSKTFNLAGLKLSCLVIPDPDLRARIRRARDRRGLYGVNPVSAAAAEAAWREGGPWLDRVLATLGRNRRLLLEACRAHADAGVRAVPPEATYLAWLDFRASGIPADRLDGFLIRRARLRLEDGAIFGPEGRGFARMNLACPRPLLERALRRLFAALPRRSVLEPVHHPEDSRGAPGDGLENA